MSAKNSRKADLIERLRRPVTHTECEDCWYSCPKSGDCCNENAGDECTCGADAENAIRKEAADALEKCAAAIRALKTRSSNP